MVTSASTANERPRISARGAGGHLGAVGVVDVAVPFARQVRPRPRQRLEDVQIRQRQTVVFGGLGEPQRLEFFQLVGVLAGQIVALAAVGVDVEELPAIGVEMPPARGCGGVDGVGEPAVVPDPTGAQHGVELGLFAGVGGRISKGRFETHAVQWLLRDALDGFRRFDVQQVVDGRGDVGNVDVVVPDLTVRRDSVGPRDDCACPRCRPRERRTSCRACRAC